MKNLKFLLITFAVITALSVVVVKLFSASDNYNSDETLVVASFYPMYIASLNLLDGVDDVRLENLSEPQTGCLHDYTLTTEDMKLLSKADIFVVNGGGIETFLTNVASEYPSLLQLDTSSLIKDGGLGDEDNSHYWMSVELYTMQIQALEEGLCEYFEEKGADAVTTETIHSNADAYRSKLEGLMENQTTVKEKLSGKDVILFHEAYGYVASDYGMNVTYLMDLDEEREISAGEAAEVMDEINNDDVRLILAEEEYGSEMGSEVERETDATVIYLDTIVRGNAADEKDAYIERMQANIDLLADYAAGIE